MKAFWTYQCDYCHTWTVLRDENADDDMADAVCPYDHPHNDPLVPSGREAVTLKKERMLDLVEVSIRPAGRIIDPETERVANEDEYYVVVRDLHLERERMTRHIYTWRQAKELLDRFRNLSPEDAWRMIDKLDTA